jgi:hypothetical protein
VRFPLLDESTEVEIFSLAATAEWFDRTLSDRALRAVAPDAVGPYK